MQWKINAAFKKMSVTPSTQTIKNDQDIANTLHAAAKENNVDDIHDFALCQLKKIPLNERLAWLRKLGADKAMGETMKKGSVEAIEAWGEVVNLLPEGSRFAFLSGKNGSPSSIATSIFSNTQPGAMKAWGKLLELVPDQNQERGKLLLTRMDHEAGAPALALLLERGEKQALDQFADLAKQHVWHGNEDIHHVLFDCLPTLKTLTSQRGNVSGKEAQDWVMKNGLTYTKPHGLSGNSEDIAKAYGKLVQLTPKKYRNDVLFPKDIWMTFTGKADYHSALSDQLGHQQARDLAHSITLLKAMVPTMTAEERKTVLNEIRSRHATKIMGVWKNTHSYEKFKKKYPAVDAMLLDLKAELKK